MPAKTTKKTPKADGPYQMHVLMDFQGLTLLQISKIEAFIKDGMNSKEVEVKPAVQIQIKGTGI